MTLAGPIRVTSRNCTRTSGKMYSLFHLTPNKEEVSLDGGQYIEPEKDLNRKYVGEAKQRENKS